MADRVRPSKEARVFERLKASAGTFTVRALDRAGGAACSTGVVPRGLAGIATSDGAFERADGTLDLDTLGVFALISPVQSDRHGIKGPGATSSKNILGARIRLGTFVFLSRQGRLIESPAARSSGSRPFF